MKKTTRILLLASYAVASTSGAVKSDRASALKFRVTNLLIGPDEPLTVTLPLQVSVAPAGE